MENEAKAKKAICGVRSTWAWEASGWGRAQVATRFLVQPPTTWAASDATGPPTLITMIIQWASKSQRWIPSHLEPCKLQPKQPWYPVGRIKLVGQPGVDVISHPEHPHALCFILSFSFLREIWNRLQLRAGVPAEEGSTKVIKAIQVSPPTQSLPLFCHIFSFLRAGTVSETFISLSCPLNDTFWLPLQFFRHLSSLTVKTYRQDSLHEDVYNLTS